MSLISAIVAVCKSLPILERLFLQIADGIKEAKAKARYEAKLDHIDAAIAFHRMSDDPGVQWSEGLTAHPQFPRAAFHAPDFTRDALKTIAELEYELERR